MNNRGEKDEKKAKVTPVVIVQIITIYYSPYRYYIWLIGWRRRRCGSDFVRLRTGYPSYTEDRACTCLCRSCRGTFDTTTIWRRERETKSRRILYTNRKREQKIDGKRKRQTALLNNCVPIAAAGLWRSVYLCVFVYIYVYVRVCVCIYYLLRLLMCRGTPR